VKPPISFGSLNVCESCNTIFPDAEMRQVQGEWICEYCRGKEGEGGKRGRAINLTPGQPDKEKR
jgi:hypothetical protein